jgi:BlaI family transcriptional regulator, penicillinase repressor
MPKNPYLDLGRRERQIMDAVYRLGTASVAEVRAAIPDPPSYSAVRAMLTRLERHGHLGHEQEGARYLYHPLHTPEEATRSALRRMLGTFFEGSAAKAVAAVLDASGSDLTPEQLDELAELIEQARRRGR